MKKLIMSVLIIALAVGFFGGAVSADPGNPINKPATSASLNDPGNPVNEPSS